MPFTPLPSPDVVDTLNDAAKFAGFDAQASLRLVHDGGEF
jgi:hypothetical protein